MSIPLEYEFTPVDEIVDIYEVNINYKYNYDIFVNKSFEIINKYKKECNPNNTKLVLVSKNCDGKFGNKYTHGGYKCGENGVWSDKCVASYCDIGYIFDYVNNKCIVDICSDIKNDNNDTDNNDTDNDDNDNDNNNDNNDNNDNNRLYYILFPIIGSILIILLLLFIFIHYRQKRINISKINSVDNIGLVEK